MATAIVAPLVATFFPVVYAVIRFGGFIGVSIMIAVLGFRNEFPRSRWIAHVSGSTPGQAGPT